MDLRYQILNETFGYDSFRPGQLPLINAILSGRDAFGVLPTGAGKSLCYQLPALLLPGITLVLSPLISLMDDQVSALRRIGIPACCIHSAMSMQDYRTAVRLLREGRCKLVYVSPERLRRPDFLSLLHSLPLSLVVVDEAHCISQWGHDFRPSYRRIPEVLASLAVRPVIAAFTATATPRVRQDITDCLHLRNPERITTSFDRPNLFFDVRRTENKDTDLLRFLKRQETFPGILYCSTRKAAEHTASLLNENNISALPYHAGMDADARAANQEAFLRDRISVLCATNAFGMGINKPNVRFVVHYQIPSSLENYYQEAGRAGRDGSPAICLLLYSEQDAALQRYLIEKEPENPALSDEEVRQLRRENFRRLQCMQRYACSDGCLREEILRYFGEQASDFCGTCCNCDAAGEMRDVTVDAQKLLSCVYRVKERADLDTLIDILRGVPTPLIRQNQWDTVSTFGILPDNDPKQLAALAAHLIHRQYLITDETDRSLHLCARAKQVLFRGETVSMMVRTRTTRQMRDLRAARHSAKPKLFAALSDLRRRLADRQGVPPSMVMSDRVLEKLCETPPQTEQELNTALGSESVTLSRFSEKILSVIANHQ